MHEPSVVGRTVCLERLSTRTEIGVKLDRLRVRFLPPLRFARRPAASPSTRFAPTSNPTPSHYRLSFLLQKRAVPPTARDHTCHPDQPPVYILVVVVVVQHNAPPDLHSRLRTHGGGSQPDAFGFGTG
jgi:hypothetical protein